MTATYVVIRFKQDEPNEVLVRGLTREQAIAHCSREDSKGEGWFDGWTEENKEGTA